MRSSLPKALHSLAGKPMVESLIARSREAGASKIFVVAGYGFKEVRAALPKDVTVIEQRQQLGSGHAVAVAEKALARCSGELLLLYCDTPLLKTATLKQLLGLHRSKKADATMLSVELEDAAHYGRVVRNGADLVER